MEKITKQQIPVLVSKMVEFQEKFSDMSKDDAQWVIQNTTSAIELFVEVVMSRKPQKVVILQTLAVNKPLIIKAQDGKTTIADSKKIFPSGIDSCFEGWGLNESTPATSEIFIQGYELVKDAKFSEMFISLNVDLEKLCFTQAQIVEFCKKHKKELRNDGWGNFFLFKKDYNKCPTPDNLFVAYVRVSSDGLGAYVLRFGRGDVWNAGLRPRVFVPSNLVA